MMNKFSYAARSLSRVSSTPQYQVRRTLFGIFGASPQAPLAAEIEDSLERAFQPSFLKVLDESEKFYSAGSPINAGTHYKVILVSHEFDYTESDAGRREMVNVVLEEQLQQGRPSHQVQAVSVNTLAMTPAEHTRIMSKYDNPDQWIAMVAESSFSSYETAPTMTFFRIPYETPFDIKDIQDFRR